MRLELPKSLICSNTCITVRLIIALINPLLFFMKTRIAIISGTDRPNSFALKISNYTNSQFLASGVESFVVDLQKFPITDVAGGRYGATIPSIQAFNEPILKADGIIFVVPEYNGSFPGILKLFIDYLPFPSAFNGMPIAYIGESSGAFGAMRAVEQLQMIVAYRLGFSYTERLFINRVNENFDSENGPVIPIQNEIMQNLIQGFPEFVNRLRAKVSD